MLTLTLALMLLPGRMTTTARSSRGLKSVRWCAVAHAAPAPQERTGALACLQQEAAAAEVALPAADAEAESLVRPPTAACLSPDTGPRTGRALALRVHTNQGLRSPCPGPETEGLALSLTVPRASRRLGSRRHRSKNDQVC